jgi:hypothetical protein
MWECEIFVNQAGIGGGLYEGSNSTADICSSDIYSNTGNTGGGGIYVSGGTVTWTNGSFTGNQTGANGAGGGLAAAGGSQVSFNGIDIERNQAGLAGGGFWISGLNTNLTLTNSTLSNNIAPPNSGAGGFYTNLATYTVSNCVVTDPIQQPQ